MTRQWRSDSGAAPVGVKVAITLAAIALVYLGFLWEQKGRQAGQVRVEPAACGCEDKADLEARRQQAQAVIDDLTQIVSELEFEGLLDAVPYSRNRQDAGKKRNSEALNNANNRNLGSGNTDENCLTKTTGSGCMKNVLQAHENVHEAECSAYKGAGDYKTSKTMAEYWKEDIRGYQAELKFIQEAGTSSTTSIPAVQQASARRSAKARRSRWNGCTGVAIASTSTSPRSLEEPAPHRRPGIPWDFLTTEAVSSRAS